MKGFGHFLNVRHKKVGLRVTLNFRFGWWPVGVQAGEEQHRERGQSSRGHAEVAGVPTGHPGGETH